MKPKLTSQETTDIVDAIIYAKICNIDENYFIRFDDVLNEADIKRIGTKLHKSIARFRNDLSDAVSIEGIIENFKKRTRKG